MQFSRRKLLIGSRNVLASMSLADIASFLFTRPAKAVPVMVAIAALQVISTFVQRPSGLAAMMRAIDEKLELILQQINQIELALADIAKAIADLGEKIPEMIENAFTEDKVVQLGGATKKWFDEKIENADDLRRLDPNRRIIVGDVASSIDKLVYILATNDQGAIPRAAIVTPFALGVHLNVVSLYEPSQIGNALTRHLGWYDSILSSRIKGSVEWWRTALNAERDKLLENIYKSHLAKLSGFNRHQWASSHAGIVVGCVREYEPRQQVGNARTKGDIGGTGFHTEPERYGASAAMTYAWRFVALTSSGYPEVGLQRSFAPEPPPWASDLLLPVCATIKVGFYNSEAALREATRQHPAVAEIEAEMHRFLEGDNGQLGLLPQLNSLNGRIAFLDSVVEIVNNTRAQALRMKAEFPQ
jgi:hypothetical protein